MIKETPLLFSTEMVKAILEGRKSMTRRIVKPKYSNTDIVWKDDKYGRRLVEMQNDVPEPVRKENPDGSFSVTHRIKAFREIPTKYKKRDLIYVRETFYAYGHWSTKTDTETGKTEWTFHDLTIDYDSAHRFFDNPPSKVHKRGAGKLGWYKRPSLFMPKAAARIWLEVESIRVERLQDITWKDIELEGIVVPPQKPFSKTHTELWKDLWIKINGAESWAANPWVWSIGFKVLSTTGKPQLLNSDTNPERSAATGLNSSNADDNQIKLN